MGFGTDRLGLYYACGPTGIRTPNLRIMSTPLSRRQMKNVGVKMVAMT